MNGVNINTKDTVTVFNLLAVEEMCINATGDKLRAVHFFPVSFTFSIWGLTVGRSQPLLKSLLLVPYTADMI